LFVAFAGDLFIVDLSHRVNYAMEPEELEAGIECLRSLRVLLWEDSFNNHVASFLLSDAIERGEVALWRARQRVQEAT
jgi:hypothetical protein